MLARRILSPEYIAWNSHWGAPDGLKAGRFPGTWGTPDDLLSWGPFAFQVNSTTREFEYPWAYHQIIGRGLHKSIVEIGGSLAGLQFVLASEGYSVTNVDPGLAAEGLGWELDPKLHEALCQAYRAPVRLIPRSIQEAGLPPGETDVVLCVSALEHFSDADLDAAAVHIPRVLKPDGVLILTADLFFNLDPFCDARSNQWGRNVNVREWLERAGLEMIDGKRDEVYGFEEFSARTILARAGEFNISRYYPVFSQCVVARNRRPAVAI